MLQSKTKLIIQFQENTETDRKTEKGMEEWTEPIL